MFEILDTLDEQAVIKVIGIGGGGGNALEHMIKAGIEGVKFINANTDQQMLAQSSAHIKIQLGSHLTKGLGAGANPDIGRQAALEDRDTICEALQGSDMVFITAGMGGGTGTGAAPVVAQIAKEMGILTVAVVTRPFPHEGRKRALIADKGICELSESVDSLITIPNEKILTVLGKQAKLLDAFSKANDVLYNAVQGISELITQPGLINVDFADVRTVMSEMGMAMMGSASCTGPDRASEATRAAISSPFLEDINMSGVRGLLVNVTASSDIEIGEFDEVGQILSEFTSDDAVVIMGAALDENMGDELRVTIVATGIDGPRNHHAPIRKQSAPMQRNTRSIERPRVSPVELTEEVQLDDDVEPQAVSKPVRTRQNHTLVSGSNALASRFDNFEEYEVPTFLRNQAD